MPLFDNGQAFFVHIPRCGGTSIEAELGIQRAHLHNCRLEDYVEEKDRLCMGNTPAPGPGTRAFELDHATAAMIRARVPDIDDKFVFAVVRNPYDRLASEFCYQQEKGSRKVQGIRTDSFANFVRSLHDAWPSILSHPNHWKVSHLLPQHLFTDGLSVKLYRTETLASDWQDICFRLRRRMSRLPRLNGSRRLPQYTQELADLVFSIYHRDFAQLSYDRHSWRPDNALSHVLVDNTNVHFHYEILESIMGDMLPAVAWPRRVSAGRTRLTVALHSAVEHDAAWSSLLRYLRQQWGARLTLVFGQESLPEHCDLHVFATTYPTDLEVLGARARAPQHRFIMHRYDGGAAPAAHCFWLAPHLAGPWFIPTQLPFAAVPRLRPGRPVVVVQGSLDRRSWTGLASVLSDARGWFAKHPFTLRIVGRGAALPDELARYRSIIDLRLNLDFISFHRAFDDACAVMACINRQDEPTYFTSRLSSSVSYAVAYGLELICCEELAALYHMPAAKTLRQVVEGYYASARHLTRRGVTRPIRPAAPHRC